MKYHFNKSWPVRIFAGYVSVTVIRCIQVIPNALLNPVLTILLPFYFLLRSKHVREVKALVDASPFSFGTFHYYSTRIQLFLEAVTHTQLTHQLPGHVHVRNPEVLDNLLNETRPILLCGLHLGGFEMCHWAPYFQVVKAHKSMTLLTAPAFSNVLDGLMSTWRSMPEKKIIQRNSPQLQSAIKETIKNKHLLAIMVDQSPHRNAGRIRLWNKIGIPYNNKILKLFVNKDAAILGITSGIKDKRIFITYQEIGKKHWGNPFDAGVWKIEMAKFIETNVCKAPEQWNWSYPGITEL